MGNSVPSSSNLTPEQLDVKLLGERFPFGDAELVLLYKSYQKWLLMVADGGSTTFLCDWSAQCGALDDRVARKILDTEMQILPKNFGNALFHASFCAPGDLKQYSLDNKGENEIPTSKDASANPSLVDEYTRKSRLDTFFEGLAGCSRRGAKSALTVLFETEYVLQDSTHITNSGKDSASEKRISAQGFVETGYRIALASAFVQSSKNVHEFLPDPDKEDALQTFSQSIVEKGRRRRQRSGLPGCTTAECPFLEKGLVELADILEWSDAVAPMFACILPTFFHFVLFPTTPFPRSRTAFEPPVIDSPSSFFTSQHVVTNPRIFTVACLSASLTGDYHRLYTSAADGLSFNRLQNAVLGYGGPTLVLIRSSSGGIFGAFTASAWKESKDFYGNTDCFLYQLSPCTAVYRPTSNERNFMYCNSAARSRGYDQQAHGIGFGGSVQEPRLFLAENFDECVAAAQDLTFDNGRLLPEVGSSQQHRKLFDIDSLEVWGVGGTAAVQAALEARVASRAVTDEAIRRARNVDKAQFLDDFKAGTFGGKAFQHRQEVDGRADADLNERNQDKDKVFDYAK